VDLSCRLYGVIVTTYPASLRREYRRELLLTFRSEAEDVLRDPRPGALLLFAVRIVGDWTRTIATEFDDPVPVSLLGVGAVTRDASGSLDKSSLSVGLLLATLGVFLLVSGWYQWLRHESAFIQRYSHTAAMSGGIHTRNVSPLARHTPAPVARKTGRPAPRGTAGTSSR